MAKPTIRELKVAMADQIRGVLDDVTDVAVQVEPYWLTTVTPPCIDFYNGDPSREEELRSFQEAAGEPLFTIRARVDTADTYAGQDLLDELMDDVTPLSIAAALTSDKTLGGIATSVYIRSQSGYVRVLEGGDYLGALWQVVVTRAD